MLGLDLRFIALFIDRRIFLHLKGLTADGAGNLIKRGIGQRLFRRLKGVKQLLFGVHTVPKHAVELLIITDAAPQIQRLSNPRGIDGIVEGVVGGKRRFDLQLLHRSNENCRFSWET